MNKVCAVETNELMNNEQHAIRHADVIIILRACATKA